MAKVQIKSPKLGQNLRYVFISYSSKDRERVLGTVERLECLGLSIWIDRNQIAGGGVYTQAIPQAIRKSSCVMLFASSNAFASRNVEREMQIAWEKEKLILPLMLEPGEVPDNFVYILGAIQHIQLFGKTEDAYIEDIQRALANWKIELAAGEGTEGDKQFGWQAQMATGTLVTYLVNRIEQERVLRQTLHQHSRQKSRRPLLLFVYGHYKQAIEEYLTRVEKISLPKGLAIIELDFCGKLKYRSGNKDYYWNQNLTSASLQ